MSVTIKDIAKAVGVSHSTVSRALNKSSLVNERTLARIRQMAGEMGYRPNVIAQGLKRKGTKTIALVVPDIANPYFITVAIGVQEKMRAFGYHMILANTNRNLETESEEIKLLCHRMIDGLVICPLSEASVPCLGYLREHEVPFVIVSRDVKGIATPVVLPDDFYGAYLATAHLADLGHTRIAHIAGPEKASVTVDRIAGYKAALSERGLSTDGQLVTMGPLDMSGGYEGARTFLERDDPPTAIFAANDLIAIGVLGYARERGIRIPEDIALVGFDDIEVARYLEVPLTTVAQPAREIGNRAGELLYEALHSPSETPFHRVIMRPTLVIRESSGAARREVGPRN